MVVFPPKIDNSVQAEKEPRLRVELCVLYRVGGGAEEIEETETF